MAVGAAGRAPAAALSAWAPTEIAPGLWRWTAPHPEWHANAEPETPDDWDQLVGSTAVELDEAFVFIDPLLPADTEGFWGWADQHRGSRAVFVLTTLAVHRRDRELVIDRYDAASSRAAAALPGGIEPRPLRGAAEVAFWIEPQRALVFGDRVLGDGRGGLRVCPESWLHRLEVGTAELAELLRQLVDLPIERVVVSHGEPVLSGGREALQRAIG
jgi:hypothetical protein